MQADVTPGKNDNKVWRDSRRNISNNSVKYSYQFSPVTWAEMA